MKTKDERKRRQERSINRLAVREEETNDTPYMMEVNYQRPSLACKRTIRNRLLHHPFLQMGGVMSRRDHRKESRGLTESDRRR